ncbi:MAG: amino acid adenylation domain-containing protein [Clostridiales bacterium]|nr:amino acid adenylation domain-containing protein [Clostridiales bacterium]
MITNVITYLHNAAKNYPDKIALSDVRGEITYRELWNRTLSVGSLVSSRLGGRTSRGVFVTIERNFDSIVAFFGVALSGNFYVPVDLTLPHGRLMSIYDTVRPELCIIASKVKTNIPFEGCEIINLSEAQIYIPDDTLYERTINTVIDTDPLYCIFTSGSTGVPKGVLISHRGVIDMAEQFVKTFSFDESAVFGNQAPFDFDVSVKDIYISLKCAATVHVLEKQLFLMVKRLIERLNDHKVNTLIWAASAMRIVSALRTFDKITPLYLRQVMFSGEALPVKVLNDWVSHIPDAEYVNLYGPTEITCNCTYYKINRRFSDSEAIPIGKPFVNSAVFLLDGEICVRGSCLALGYYGDHERTEKAFCQNPLQSAYPEKIYRTGDLARYEDGDLIFLGRADSQVKHMGHRIELGEIEIHANAIGFITSACCLYDEKREKLTLFYEAKEQDDKAVFTSLKSALPAHMIPNRLVYMKTMPANRTGKIDRALLKKTYIEEA